MAWAQAELSECDSSGDTQRKAALETALALNGLRVLKKMRVEQKTLSEFQPSIKTDSSTAKIGRASCRERVS